MRLPDCVIQAGIYTDDYFEAREEAGFFIEVI
jgi:hypothetical protein